MEATIKSNQMDVDKEEAKPNPEVESFPEPRHIWRIPELPPSPRSSPTNFDVNSESELIHANISRVEPFPSGQNRILSMPIQELVQRRQRGGVGNMPKPLEGGHEVLLTHQGFSVLGEDHRSLRRLEPFGLQRQGQKDNELVEKSKSFFHRPEKGVVDDPSFGERRPSGIYQLQTSSRSVQGQAQKTSEETESSQEQSGKRQTEI
ncbi:hypothetical protein O181_083113 [Austropuccinia psidii MF-1]|uniref:Uncharacterized protein n=1 Tax=Austropuccinia psidii MF-1 TaxID=1389203 RepID=A0A9Q3IJ86_9BASI|nr:hypothetical protein [Austropuccinia psidii MF-1]